VQQTKDRPEQLTHGCSGCDETWFGLRRVHCSVDHVTLDDETLWDLHRVEGQCVWPGKLGLVRNKGGVWQESVQVIPSRRAG
jgi:hypothetical protein